MRNNIIKRIVSILAVLLIGCAGAFGGEWLCQRGVLALSPEARTDTAVDLSVCSVSGAAAAPADEAADDEMSGEELWDEEWDDGEWLDDEALYDEYPEEQAEPETGARRLLDLLIARASAEEAPEDELLEDEFLEEDLLEEDLLDEDLLEEDLLEAEQEGAAGSSLTLDTPAARLSVPWDGYIEDLTLTVDSIMDQSYTVVCELGNGETVKKTSFYLSTLGEDTIHIGETVKRLEISFGEGAAAVTGIVVNNSLHWNTGRMMLFGLMALAAATIFVFRKFMGRKPEFVFLTVALAVGLFLSVCLPTNVNLSFDDQIHARHIYRMSYGYQTHQSAMGDRLESMAWSTSASSKEGFYHVLDTWRDNEALRRSQDAVEDDWDGETEPYEWTYSDIGHVPQAVALAVSRALGASNSAQIIWMRVVNMLWYVGICFFAVRALKRFKWLMAAVALMPGVLYLACNLSYDPTTNALCFLGIALAVDSILDRNTKLTWQRAMGILMALLVGGIAKTVYMPLMLLTWLLPRSKFDSNGQRIGYKAITVVIMVFAVLSMVRSVNAGNTVLMDERASGANSDEQIRWLLSHPVQYLGYFFAYLWKYVTVYFVDICRTSWAYLGSMSGTLDTLSLGLLFFCAFTGNDAEDGTRTITWKQRLGFLIVAGLAIGLTFTTMYVAYSKVGEFYFGGVQARYMTPLLPLVYMILSPDGIKNKLNRSGWAVCFGVINLIILGVLSWRLVVLPFWL